LLKKGANPNVLTFDGFTTLNLAAGLLDMKSVDLLLGSEKIQIEATNSLGLTALQVVVINLCLESNLHRDILNIYVEIVERLIKAKANINAAIPAAIFSKYITNLNVSASNLNSEAERHYNLVHFVVLKKNAYVLQMLLNAGANPNILIPEGQGALHLAISDLDTKILDPALVEYRVPEGCSVKVLPSSADNNVIQKFVSDNQGKTDNVLLVFDEKANKWYVYGQKYSRMGSDWLFNKKDYVIKEEIETDSILYKLLQTQNCNEQEIVKAARLYLGFALPSIIKILITCSVINFDLKNKQGKTPFHWVLELLFAEQDKNKQRHYLKVVEFLFWQKQI